MFSLIITIISIVLVGLLAVATIYYGGDAFSNRGDEARADRVLNEGQQLAGAAVLAKNDGLVVTGVADLNPEYVTGDFATWNFSAGAPADDNGTPGDTTDDIPATSDGFTTLTTAGVCAKLTEKVGVNDKITASVSGTDCTVRYEM
mgnify:CR=1 FL=1